MDEVSQGLFCLRKGPSRQPTSQTEEVTAAANRLKEKHPQALLSVESLVAVVHMACLSDRKSDGSDNESQWAENKTKDAVHAAMVLMPDPDASELDMSIKLRDLPEASAVLVYRTKANYGRTPSSSSK